MLNLKSFIVDDELIIDKPNWYKLKNEYSQQELKDAIRPGLIPETCRDPSWVRP